MRLTPPPASALRSTSAECAFGVFAKAMSRETTRANAADLAQRMVIADTITAWLEALDEPAREAFFVSIEAVAKTANRRRIASHPLRPAGLDADADAALGTPDEPTDPGTDSEVTA